MWTETERVEFETRIGILWPSKRDRHELLGLWIKDLQGFPSQLVMRALDDTRRGGFTRLPEIPDLVTLCKHMQGAKYPSGKSNTPRRSLIARLQILAGEGAMFRSPKTGALWHILSGGVVLQTSDRPTGAIGSGIPWGMMELGHLEAILDDNERHIEHQGPPITWTEFVRSGGVLDVIERTEKRGESAAWLKRRLPSWESGADHGFGREPGEEG